MLEAFHIRCERIRTLGEIAAGRLRARLAAFRGAQVGAKTRIGPNARIDRPWTLSLGVRCEIEAGVWFKVVADDAVCRVGDFAFFGRGAELDIAQRVEIGDRVMIAPGTFITDHQHQIFAEEGIGDQGCRSAPVIIEAGAWLGAHCVVLPGVRIGRGAVVGAGAIVTRDVPPEAIVAGIPARVLRYRQPRPTVEDSPCQTYP
jgi:acetyltransferase-like isoleucine patch superfamily enzyme